MAWASSWLGLGHLQVVLFTEKLQPSTSPGSEWGGGGEDIPVGVVADRQGGLAGLMLVELAALHDLGQGGGRCSCR